MGWEWTAAWNPTFLGLTVEKGVENLVETSG